MIFCKVINVNRPLVFSQPRSIHTGQREDYLHFNATTPPASAFDGPAWLKGLECIHVDSATEMPTQLLF